MNQLTANYSDGMRTTDAPPASIGRGTGCTIKELNRRLNDLLRKKGMTRERWRVMPNFRKSKPAPAPLPPPPPCRIRKADLWSQL